jgi:hypothetical protein
MPGGVDRRSNAHFGVSQRLPLRNNLRPSRRHSLQTGPVMRPMMCSLLDPWMTRTDAAA